MECVVIGGANMDVQGFPYGKFRLRDSNPGRIKLSPGGVGRNIADNLSRLGVETSLLTAIGDDANGRELCMAAERIGLDMSGALICPNASTSTYIALMDEHGDMAAALSHMDIMEQVTAGYLERQRERITGARLLVIDANISYDAIDYLTSEYKATPAVLDTVSVAKALRVKDIIGRFHTIKPNRIEAEALSGIQINGAADSEGLKRMEHYFLGKGIKRLFLSLSEQGLFYSDGRIRGILARNEVKPVNATGAGDAFVAAAAYGLLRGLELEYTARFAQAAAALTLAHPDTISQELNVKNIKKMLGE